MILGRLRPRREDEEGPIIGWLDDETGEFYPAEMVARDSDRGSPYILPQPADSSFGAQVDVYNKIWGWGETIQIVTPEGQVVELPTQGTEEDLSALWAKIPAGTRLTATGVAQLSKQWADGLRHMHSASGYTNVPPINMTLDQAIYYGYLPWNAQYVYTPENVRAPDIGYKSGSHFGGFISGLTQSPAFRIMMLSIAGFELVGMLAQAAATTAATEAVTQAAAAELAADFASSAAVDLASEQLAETVAAYAAEAVAESGYAQLASEAVSEYASGYAIDEAMQAATEAIASQAAAVEAADLALQAVSELTPELIEEVLPEVLPEVLEDALPEILEDALPFDQFSGLLDDIPLDSFNDGIEAVLDSPEMFADELEMLNTSGIPLTESATVTKSAVSEALKSAPSIAKQAGILDTILKIAGVGTAALARLSSENPTDTAIQTRLNTARAQQQLFNDSVRTSNLPVSSGFPNWLLPVGIAGIIFFALSRSNK